MTRVIIAGGGLAGCLAARALANRTDLKILLVEQGPAFGGNHTWSFFDSDIAPEHRWIVDGMVGHRWDDHEVHFPSRSRTISTGYNSIRSTALDSEIRGALRPDQYRLGATIVDVSPTQVFLADGERLDADAVIDARGSGSLEGLDLGWQKFVGRTYECAAGHHIARPVIMDATVKQLDGYRFLYFLPFSRSKLLIEDTYYSLDPGLDAAELETRLDRAAARLCAGPFKSIEQESGVLPVILDGRFERFWELADPVPRIGVRGGFFHPTTSYSLPDAIANAALLAGHRDFHPRPLVRLLRNRAERLWNDRALYRLLNRMLFHAAEPDQAYRILQHFYRLPQDVIARFYACRMTSLDKFRVLSGRPPVPIGRALRALGRRAA